MLASSWLGPGDFPNPVGTPLIVGLGVVLIAVGAVLWRLAGTIDLRALAAANLTTAVIAVVWLLAAKGFSTAGTAVTTATSAALALLAFAQVLGSGS